MTPGYGVSRFRKSSLGEKDTVESKKEDFMNIIKRSMLCWSTGMAVVPAKDMRSIKTGFEEELSYIISSTVQAASITY